MGLRWSVDEQTPELHLTANSLTLACTTHDKSLEKAGGPLDLADLGAFVLERQGVPRLYYWADAARSPDLIVISESTTDGLIVRYRGGRGPRIRVQGERLSMAAVKCDPVGMPPSDNGEPDSTLPLKLDYLELLERHEWLAASRSWRVSLRGRGRSEDLDCRNAERELSDAGVIVWPRKPPENWYCNVVGAYSSRAPEIALVERDGDDRLHRSEFLKWAMTIGRRGRAAFVAFRADGQDRGVLPVRRPSSPTAAAAASGLLAIDFGTSSTTVVYKHVGADAEHFVLDGCEQPAQTCQFVSKGANFPRSLQLAVFSGWHQTPTPSELQGTLLIRRTDDLSESHWYSVIPRDRNLVGQLKEEPRTKVYADLKWEDLNRFDREALEAYLERALLPAFLALADTGVRSVRLAASYPLAFEPNRLAAFKAALDRAVQSLSAGSGVVVQETVRVSESHAGIRALPALFASYSLTIDMGGGTTDLAILHEGRVLAADSLRIGGRALLAALSRDQDEDLLLARLRDAMGVPHRGPLGVSRETLIETLLQTMGMNATVAAIQPGNSIVVRQACAALLAGVALAAHRFLEVTLPSASAHGQRTVNLALLGQGWHLLRPELMAGFSEEGFIEVLRALSAGCCTIQDTGGPTDSKERKLLLAKGALQLLSAGVRDESAALLPTFIGMELKTSQGEVSRSTPLGGFDRTAVAHGDPGYEAVVEELVDTMRRFQGPHSPIGDPRMWLSDPAPGVVGRTRRQLLIEQACGDLRNILNEHQGTLSRSPLTHFLSGAWRQAWVSSQTPGRA